MSRVALVTGGSRGIGAACAVLAAQDGWSVAVNYTQNSLAADEVVRQIRALGGNAIAVQADVGDEAQIIKMFETVDAKLGRLGALVNNAGVVDMPQRVDEMSVARLERMFRINVTGSFVCAREAVRRMSTKHGGQGGVIVNVSSSAVRSGSHAQYVDYAASKGAVDTLTIGLAKEVAAEGIRVNSIRPGMVLSEMTEGRLKDPDFKSRIEASIPMRRVGQTPEIADAILWLLSDEASYATGTFIDVSGGR